PCMNISSAALFGPQAPVQGLSLGARGGHSAGAHGSNQFAGLSMQHGGSFTPANDQLAAMQGIDISRPAAPVGSGKLSVYG
ncbi:MAG: hypothetical protein KTR14_06325, partial [Vampirovibrio sp.]|nr:hypothetical protein [Vampirovibrio sp.]